MELPKSQNRKPHHDGHNREFGLLISSKNSLFTGYENVQHAKKIAEGIKAEFVHVVEKPAFDDLLEIAKEMKASITSSDRITMDQKIATTKFDVWLLRMQNK